ncbi:MAG: lytic transglycosylase domain-containing protein [Actinobacteria bacterium]|nr:lytic transglycosylase domain-containing protein [Actinomycetota bacterium]
MKLILRLLILIVLAILALALYPAAKRGVERLFYPLEHSELIKKASVEHSLDPYLISAVIFEESKFDPAIRSKAGAVGLMQIMPETGRWVAARQGRLFREEDLLKPGVNIDMGSWYLRYLKAKYNDEDLAVAAYNGGMENVDKWMSAGQTPETTVERIPFKETREFVARVKKSRAKYRELYENELK